MFGIRDTSYFPLFPNYTAPNKVLDGRSNTFAECQLLHSHIIMFHLEYHGYALDTCRQEAQPQGTLTGAVTN